MKHYIKGAFLTLAAAGMLSLGSCSDKLDLTNPDALSGNGFWKNSGQFEGNLYALMNQWRGNYDANVLFYAGEQSSGLYSNGSGPDGTGFRYLIQQQRQLTINQPQFTNFMNFYGMIANCNTFIYYASPEQNGGCMEDATRNYLLGMIHGMRAYCYFQIHKMYGSGPLRTEPDVMLGNYDEISLQKETATPADFVAQIKDDLKKSEDYFAAGASYKNAQFQANNGAYYWSPMATQMLAGEVYLWTGKVSTTTKTGTLAANPADVAIAEQHFQKVAQGNYSLMPTPQKAINTKVGNTEVIFATNYALGEATTNWFNYMTYDVTVGLSMGKYWSPMEADGTTWQPVGATASTTSYYYNPTTQVNERNTFYFKKINGQQHMMYKNELFYQFDREDSRIYWFQPNYCIYPEQCKMDDEGNRTSDPAQPYCENFNPDDYYLGGCYFWKYEGSQGYGDRFEGTNDMIYYRLPLAYTYLAECANYRGANAEVEKYINLVRQRAYGDNWDANKYGYKASDFKTNEVAILQEKMKEFLQEGQHWWDERRMTTVKGGTEKDHMLFQPEGNCGYGLDAASHPLWTQTNSGIEHVQAIDTNTPVLNYDTDYYKVLWPLDATLLASDAKVSQNPGYDDPRETDATE